MHVFSLPYGFLRAIFFSLARFMGSIRYRVRIPHRVSVSGLSVLPARLPVDCRLLVVKSWSPEFYLDFQRPGGVGTRNPELFKGQRCTQWGFLSLLLPTQGAGAHRGHRHRPESPEACSGSHQLPDARRRKVHSQRLPWVSWGRTRGVCPPPLDPKRIPLPPCRLCLELHNSQTTGKGPRSPSTDEQAI